MRVHPRHADFGTRRQLTHQPVQRPQPGRVQHRPRALAPPTPNTSVASQRIVPGEPSGKSITNNNTPFHRLNDFAASSRPNNGCVSATTRTSHGNTARNCCSLSPSLPAPARPTWRSGWRSRACQAGHRVLFATAAEWVARLAEAHHAGRIHAELTRLGRYPLIVVDEVGYIPFEPEAANLFFQLVSSRYERASLIVTSNKAVRPLGRSVRRRRRRRRHDRPPRAPRRGHHHQRNANRLG